MVANRAPWHAIDLLAYLGSAIDQALDPRLVRCDQAAVVPAEDFRAVEMAYFRAGRIHAAYGY